MLVLSRKTGERIVIDGNITITVIKARNQQVRLGIEAPSEVAVWRMEMMAGKETAFSFRRNAPADPASAERMIGHYRQCRAHPAPAGPAPAGR
jgi:carbon storage regulator